MKQFLFFFVLVGILGTNGKAQNFDPFLAQKLQQKLDDVLVNYGANGISVGIIYPGKGLWLGTSGFSHQNVPITSDMEFGIGSNTKLFTAIAVLKLVQRKQIGIDDSIGKYLQPIANVNGKIKIGQLLNHSSGIADIIFYPGYVDTVQNTPTRLFAPEEILKFIGPRAFAPGARTEYSSSNYIIAGLLFEKVSGQNIATFIRDSILTPNDLDSTFFDGEETVLGTIAHPWLSGVDIDSIPRTAMSSSAWSTGAIYSNAHDMVKWYDAIMNGRILDQATFDILTDFSQPVGYGHGINKSKLDGRTVWGANGAILGYRSKMVYDPQTKAILCVLLNTHLVDIEKITKEIFSTLNNNITTGLSENNFMEDGPLLFPNPSSGKVFIDAKNQEIENIQVFSTIGQLVINTGSENNVLEDLPKGIYFVKIKSNKGVFVNKLVVE
jgi:D-alanyl-D-alanine carboxypeptidase